MINDISLSSLKLSHAAREFEEKKIKDRRRNLLVLVRHFLHEEGFFETLRHFDNEARIPESLVICDNVDLSTILQDYESYYSTRFNKLPKICRKEQDPMPTKQAKTAKQAPVKAEPKPDAKQKKEDGRGDCSGLLSVSSLLGQERTQEVPDVPKPKLRKPLSALDGFSEEWRAYADIIAKEILVENLSMKWEDITGLEKAKEVLKEAIVYPTKYPSLFKGILTPWKGLLLYGPPGTGKTLLAKAVATECNTTFFNISASTIVSKWRGDSEKLIRVMVEMARQLAPSTLFLDEVDCIASARGSASEHEASRRLKAELLVQLDGIIAGPHDGVFVLATSNMPWELDPGILRRLEKRILVDVPDKKAREEMFKRHLPEMIFLSPKLESFLDYQTLSRKTEGYSGSDIRLICREAVMEAMREIFLTLESKQALSQDVALKSIKLDYITTEDVLEALKKIKPTSSHLISKYRDWKIENDAS